MFNVEDTIQIYQQRPSGQAIPVKVLGYQLNLIQGAPRKVSEIEAQISFLWRDGKITQNELKTLIAESARQGLLELRTREDVYVER